MPGAEVRRTAVRAQDLLVAEFRFTGLDLDPSGTRLTPSGTADPVVVVNLPPQHVLEESFSLHGRGPPDELPSAQSRIAGWSRLAFRLPAGTASVPLELEALLRLLESCELRVVDAALPRSEDPSPPSWPFAALVWIWWLIGGSGPRLRAPRADETAVELPFRLLLSPTQAARFVHNARPIPGSAGMVELWHSQLGIAPGELGKPDAGDRTVRGVWLRGGEQRGHEWRPDEPVPTPDETHEPFQSPLNHNTRHQIVHLSANFRARSVRPWTAIYPRAIHVRRLALTSLGASVDLQGDWEPPDKMSLAGWLHRGTVGRDQLVRVVKAGWLFPFGHRATRVEIHERHFDDGEAHAAFLRWRMFIVVRDHERDYAVGTAPTPQLGRTMPLRHVRILTATTPDLVLEDKKAFAIRRAGDGLPVLFQLAGSDAAGNRVEFRTPLWFVAQDALDGDVDAAVSGYGVQDVPLVDPDGSTPAGGLPLDILALEDSGRPDGRSIWSARRIAWRGERARPAAGAFPQPPFHPKAAALELRLPAVELIEGSPKQPARIAYHDRFVQHGFDPTQNPGTLVAGIASGLPLSFAGKGDRAGALVRPELAMRGLSHRLGPVAGAKLADIASNRFQPSDFFAGALPKLFGSLELDRMLAATELFDGDTPLAPKLLPLPRGAELSWEPKLRDYPDAPNAIFATKPDSKLELVVTAQTGADAQVRCKLERFALQLVPPKLHCVDLHFARAVFETRGGKPDVDIELEKIEFVGALSFVEELRKLIPSDAFSDPPALNVTPSGVDATVSLSVPSLTVGMFSLENISLGAGVLVPFDQRALAVRFHFCERHEPFLLTVSALGGGGFFLIELDARGVQRIEAALEFGASLSMDFVVASGSVHAMAGLYFAYDTTLGATLTGYFRVGGNVSVMGLISATIELCLALSYKEDGKAEGMATLTIEVDVFLFSASVELTCERTLAGSASDPRFDQLMERYKALEGKPPRGLELPEGEWPWREYWAAYA